MNTLDRRSARSRNSLQQALMALMAEKRYEAITVKDICEAANVGRSTFYAHYRGKDELKLSGLAGLRGALEEQQRREELGFGLALFRHAREYLGHYRALGTKGRAVALGGIRAILEDLLRAEFSTRTCGNPRIPRDVAVAYLVGAYLAVLTWWLDRGADVPPERLDEMCRALAGAGLSGTHG